MKLASILFIPFLLLIIFWQASYAQFHWHSVLRDTSENKQYFFGALSSADNKNAAVIGSVFNYKTYSHLFMSSEDSGNSWHDGNLGLSDFQSWGAQFQYLSSVDSLHIYAGSDNGYFTSSSDGGISWASPQRLTKDHLTGISFCDTLHGLAIGPASEILTTSDGGRSWKLTTPLAEVSLAGCKAFPGGKYFVADQYLGEVFRSTDYGNSWDTVVAYQPSANGSEIAQTTNLYFRDTMNGFLIGAKPVLIDGFTNFFPVIVKTSDGGSTWKTVVDSSSGNIQDLFSICFLDDRRGIAVGRYYHDLMTNDGGNTWYEDTVDLAIHDWIYLSQVIRLSATKVLAIASATFYSNVIIGELATNSVMSSAIPNVPNPPFHPNPVTSDLYLDEGAIDNVKKIIIYDMLGRKIEEYGSSAFSDGSINCHSLRPGIYWLEMMHTDGINDGYKMIKE